MQIIMVPISKLKRDVNQPRTYFDPIRIEEMAQSIVTEGVVNPIEIDKNFVIITGELRARASKIAGLKEVPCKMISIKAEHRFRRQVIENIHSSTMSDLDTANAVVQLLSPNATVVVANPHGGRPDRGITKLAREIGKSESFIRHQLDLFNASSAFKEAVKKGLSASYLQAISLVPKEYKKTMEDRIIKGEFKTRDTSKVVAQAIKAYPEMAKKVLDKDYSGMELKQVVDSIHKTIPNYTETPATKALITALQPSEELSAAIYRLSHLLEKYSILDIGNFNIPRVIVSLQSLSSKMSSWVEKAPEKLLK